MIHIHESQMNFGPFQNERCFHIENLAITNFRFVLVIQSHPKAWLHPIKDALAKEFQAMAKTWALSANSVAVLNKEMAIEHGLVSPQ